MVYESQEGCSRGDRYSFRFVDKKPSPCVGKDVETLVRGKTFLLKKTKKSEE